MGWGGGGLYSTCCIWFVMLRIVPARLFEYQLVGIPNAESSCWVLQWNIGLRDFAKLTLPMTCDLISLQL